MTRPLSFAKVEATGKSYSDHEALEVDLELSNSNKKSNRESKRKVNSPNILIRKCIEKTHIPILLSLLIRILNNNNSACSNQRDKTGREKC